MSLLFFLFPLIISCSIEVTSVSGYVYDSAGEPILDASITLDWYGRDTDRSDDNGFYYIEQSVKVVLLAPGAPFIIFEKEGYTEVRVEDIEGFGDNRIDVYLIEE